MKYANVIIDGYNAIAGSGNYTKYWRDLADWGTRYV